MPFVRMYLTLGLDTNVVHAKIFESLLQFAQLKRQGFHEQRALQPQGRRASNHRGGGGSEELACMLDFICFFDQNRLQTEPLSQKPSNHRGGGGFEE